MRPHTPTDAIHNTKPATFSDCAHLSLLKKLSVMKDMPARASTITSWPSFHGYLDTSWRSLPLCDPVLLPYIRLLHGASGH